MNFTFFEQLNKEEAKLYLERFLQESGDGFKSMIPLFEENTILVDYSFQSLVNIFKWLSENIKTTPKESDKTLPIWITETDSYVKGLYNFDENSSILILRVSFYLGECFIKNFNTLKWSIGNSKYAECNMPVIKGFNNKMELAPILVSENIIKRLVEGGDLNRVNSTIEAWKKCIE